MNWKIFIVLLFILGVLFCMRDSKNFSGRDSENDSLDYFFEQANIDTLPYAKRLLFTEKALAIVQEQPNDSMNRVNYFKVANRYWNMKKWVEFRRVCDSTIKNAYRDNDEFSIAKGMGYIGDYNAQNNIIDSAYYYYNKSGQLYQRLKTQRQYAEMLIQKSRLQYLQKDYSGGENTLYKVLRMLKMLEDYNGDSIEAYDILGSIYSDLNEYDKAIEIYNRAIQKFKIGNFPSFFKSKAQIYNNIGIVYEHKREYKKAVFFYNLGLNEKDIRGDNIFLYSTLKNNLAYSNFKLNKLKSTDDFYEALQISDSVLDYSTMVYCRLNLSEFSLFYKKNKEANFFAKIALQKAKEFQSKELILASLKQLIITDPKNASKYSQEYYTLTDSLALAERRNRNKFARIEYETEELTQEKNQLIAQKQNYTLIAIIVFLIIITTSLLGFIIFKRRQIKLKQQKQKAAAEIYRLQLDQQQKIEDGKQIEKNKIAKELHDGVMGKLTSIRLNLFVLNKKTDIETIDKCLVHIDEIQAIEKEIRTIAYALHNDVSGNLNTEIL
ncbi:MAG: histidine kinase [Flavobacterium sp.]|nr:histidine kinase [Flavobacterium sp.]